MAKPKPRSKTSQVKRSSGKGIPQGKKAKRKIATTMGEFKEGELHSGSKSGPLVTSRKQAIAIALSQSRKVNKRSRRTKARKASTKSK